VFFYKFYIQCWQVHIWKLWNAILCVCVCVCVCVRARVRSCVYVCVYVCMLIISKIRYHKQSLWTTDCSSVLHTSVYASQVWLFNYKILFIFIYLSLLPLRSTENTWVYTKGKVFSSGGFSVVRLNQEVVHGHCANLLAENLNTRKNNLAKYSIMELCISNNPGKNCNVTTVTQVYFLKVKEIKCFANWYHVETKVRLNSGNAVHHRVKKLTLFFLVTLCACVHVCWTK
jgi:hypothetical protein